MVWNPGYTCVVQRKNIGVKSLQCPVCKSKMVVTDEDYNFKGNSDIYWVCENPHCRTGCIEEVRFSQSFKEFWSYETLDREMKEWVIKKKIDFKKVKK